MKKAAIITGIALAMIVFMALKTLRDAGEFKTLQPRSNCNCVKVQNAPGPEDIVIDHSTGIAYISSFDRRAYLEGGAKQGAIFSYNLMGTSRLKNLTAGLAFTFRPHGLSLYRGPGGRRLLFVINHQKERNTVEVFLIGEKGLRHLETISDDLLISPNDIAAVGPRSFYFTNDHGSRSEFGRTMEEYLRLPRSNIAYYDGKGVRVVAEGLRFANGIWADREGSLLYAATTTGKEFLVYRRSVDGGLNPEVRLSLDTGADNIDVAPDGRILVASHPQLLTFVKHAKNRGKKAPSQILEVVWDRGGGYDFREIFLDGGGVISAASVAAAYGDRLLVGAVFEEFFLDCRCAR